jgi:hypothetical protein
MLRAMGALAHLESSSLTVTPGAEAVAVVRVRNTGTVVDQFTIDVLGDAQPWAAAEPPVLSLFPGAEETARVLFRPPRSPEVPAGPTPFGIRVQSKEDPTGSVVEEGILDIEAFAETFAELAPRTSRGSRGAGHDLAIDNRGNSRLNATISAADPDRLLDFDVRPPGVVADPGTAAFARVQVKARDSFWRGTPKTRPFRVQVETPGAAPIGVDGTLLQEPILPPWFMRAVVGALALVVAALLFWLFFLQPVIESTAQERAEEILAQHGLTPLPGTGDGDGNGDGNGNGNGDGNGNGESPTPGTGDGSPSPLVPTLPGGALPRDGRIAGGQGLEIGAGKTLFVTDLVFSNRNTDAAGDISLRRNDDALMVLRAENFRDLDFHFVTPIAIASGQQLRLTCELTFGSCDSVAVYYSGFER